MTAARVKKVLIVGGGGREHALAWKLASDNTGTELVCAPGNAGIADLARCIPVPATDLHALDTLADAERPDVTIIGPEAPLAAGLADRLTARGHAVFGPSAAAARIESSKSFAKALMLEAGIPTASARAFTEARDAKAFAAELGAPVVIKATGLAAGKGVIVCGTLAEADRAIHDFLERRSLGDAGREILVEEFMQGEELSVLAVTDGERFATFLPARDHKRLGDGDTGPNTGGMGAYAPVADATPRLMSTVRERILAPTLAALRARGSPFQGVLYAGLMLTPDGPKVIEFNCRFGDPETQVILPLLDTDLFSVIETVAHGGMLSDTALTSKRQFAVTTVVAAPGYPAKPRLRDTVDLPPVGDDVLIFHAGTARDPNGRLITTGGRVLSVTGLGRTLDAAAKRSREYASSVALDGKQFRRDIAAREIQRSSTEEPPHSRAVK